jgi:hypothetical protein
MTWNPTPFTPSAGTRVAPGSPTAVGRGLLVGEWLVHRWWMSTALLAWFVCTWILFMFLMAKELQTVGILAGLLAGMVLGRADVSEGCEEFTFSLPPTRSQRYSARILIGLVPLVVLQSVAALAGIFNLPQQFWGLFVESGLTEPFPYGSNSILYLPAVFVPALAFSVVFVATSLARSRTGAGAHTFLGVLIFAGIWWAVRVVSQVNAGMGFFPFGESVTTSALTAIIATLVLTAGWFAFIRKEGITEPGPGDAGRHAGIAAWTAFLVAILVAVLMVFLLVGTRPERAAHAPPPAMTGKGVK